MNELIDCHKCGYSHTDSFICMPEKKKSYVYSVEDMKLAKLGVVDELYGLYLNMEAPGADILDACVAMKKKIKDVYKNQLKEQIK